MSLRGVKITFLSITFELLIQSLRNIQTKVWKFQDLSFDAKFVQIGAEIAEKIELQCFYYFAHNF